MVDDFGNLVRVPFMSARHTTIPPGMWTWTDAREWIPENRSRALIRERSGLMSFATFDADHPGYWTDAAGLHTFDPVEWMSHEEAARLIEAAPKLLAALSTLRKACNAVRPFAGTVARVESDVIEALDAKSFLDAIAVADAAIAKATGAA